MSDPVTPRVLIEYTFYETRSADDVDHVAFDAIVPNGTVRDGPGYESRVIGYVEVEPHTQLPRETSWAAFMATVRDRAEYVHVKDDAPSV